ncbi:hypothetical protein ACMZ75_03990 [Gardnerella piotii]|uniref:hypothetical protein n=1 Tax=Gardnerella piotii TaxID=2792977 RepID=UPI0039EE1987
MGKHGCKGIPIFLRNKRTRMFSLLTALLATIAIVVGNGVISGAYAFDDIPTYISDYSGCGAVGNYRRLLSVDDDITYCVDTHDRGSLITDTTWGPVINNRDVAIAAMMIKLNVSGRSGYSDYRDRVAIAYAIHEHFEDKDKWNKAKQDSFNTKDFSEIASKADELWNEAASKIPTKVLFENNYGTSGSSGEIKVKAEGITRTAYSGNNGVDFKITASNENIKFKDNYYYNNSELKEERKGFIRTDKDYSDDFVWVATGEGKVDINGEYYLPNLDRRDTKKGCYLLRLSQSPVKYNIDSSISIDAHRNFYPTVTSKSEVKKLKLGDSVEGNVKSGVNYEDNKPWIKDKKIRARGYYFVGSHENILKERAAGSNVDDYLKELRADSNIRQVGASDVYFTKSGEEAKAVVHVTNGDMKPENLEKATEYKVGEQDAGLFGTWVWTIAKNEQDNDVKDFVSSDFIEGFGKAQSTLTHIAKVNIKHVKNDKNKDSNEVSDTIVVSGAPKDYGMFKGNKEYGFDGDENMKVRLWWIGYENGTVDKESMSKLNPKSDKEPEEDDNHKKVGEWSVPLRNGVYTIANGKVMLKEASADGAAGSGAAGNTETGNGKEGSDLGKKVADIVNLKSGNSGESGMYVFVYDFPGSSRAEAFKTAFNDVDSKSVFNKQNVTNHSGKQSEPGKTSDPGKQGEANPGKTNPGGVNPGSQSQSGNAQNGGKQSGENVQNDGTQNGTQNGKQNTNQNGNQSGTSSSENTNSGNVTGSEVDPKTSPSGGVVDNIISKQNPQGSGVQAGNNNQSGSTQSSGKSEPGKQEPGKEQPGNVNPGKQEQPGVQKPGGSSEKPGNQKQSGTGESGKGESGKKDNPGGSSEKPGGLQPGGTQNNGGASSGQNGGASDVKNGNKSGESSGEPAGSGNVTGSEVDPKTSPSGGVVDNIISKQNPQNPQSPQNQQGSGVQAGNTNQSGSTQGSGKNNPGKQQQPGNVNPGKEQSGSANPVKSEPGVQKPGGSSEKPGGTQGSSAQNEVAGTQSGRAQVGNNAQSGVNAGANNNTLGAQVDAGTNNTVHQNADATGESNAKSNANNDKISEKNNKKDGQSNVNTDSQHKSEHVEGKEDSKEGKYTATKSGAIQRGDSKKVDTYQSATQQGDSQYGDNQQVSDSNVEQNSQSNNQYASGTKNSKRRHARLGANVGHLVTTGVKVETTLMFSLAILLIAGSVILVKRASYIA